MWAQLPSGVWVSALVTILYTFVCLIANVLMLWLTWVHREKLSYVAIIGYLTLLCTICSIIQQMYEYEHWEDFMWAQHYYILEHLTDANAWFHNGNFGFRLVLSNIRLFTNDATAALCLSFAIQIAGTVYNFWAAHQRAERNFNVLGKVLPILLAALSVGLLQTPGIQANWTAYMVVANGLSVLSCALSFVFFVAIITQYVRAKRSIENWRGWVRYKARGLLSSFRNSRDRERRRRQRQQQQQQEGSEEDPDSGRRVGGGLMTTNASWAQMSLNKHSIYDSWLVTRLSVLALMLWVFILVTLITHIEEKDNVTKGAKNPTPNLTAKYAHNAILGYMPAVTPGLLLFIVFGTTKTLRQTMYETFVPRSWRLRRQQRRQRRRGARHVHLETSPSQQSPYLRQEGDVQFLDPEAPPLPPGAIDLKSSQLRRKAGAGPAVDIELGHLAESAEEPRNRS